MNSESVLDVSRSLSAVLTSGEWTTLYVSQRYENERFLVYERTERNNRAQQMEGKLAPVY